MQQETQRKGGWLQSYTGGSFWPLDPKTEDLDIIDIAHSLSQQCRFLQRTRTFYSVAEHSVRGLAMFPADHIDERRAFLLHDADEAYIIDLPRPMKQLPAFAFYRKIEAKWQQCIAVRFGIDPDFYTEGADKWRIIKYADDCMLATEKRDLMAPSPRRWSSLPEPLPERITETWLPVEAEWRFIQAFRELFGEEKCT